MSTTDTPDTPALATLADLPDVVAALADRVAPSVVTIGRDRRGAGVVVAPDRVLTNAHNLRDRTTSVAFPDGRVVQGRVTAADVDGDLAVLEVETGDAPALPLPEAEPDLALGTAVFAVGRAGPDTPRVTFGTVSAVARRFRGPRGRRVSGGVEHTAPLVRGSSGTPLVTADGTFVGLNTHRIRGGLYLALPLTADLRERVDALGRGETPTVAHLGVALAPPRVADELRRSVGLEPAGGLLVREVTAEGAAARAGIEQGDLLTAVAGTPLASPSDLHDALRAVGVTGEGDEGLTLTVLRGTDERTVQVTFTEDDVRPRDVGDRPRHGGHGGHGGHRGRR